MTGKMNPISSLCLILFLGFIVFSMASSFAAEQKSAPPLKAEEEAPLDLETGQKLSVSGEKKWNFELTPYIWATWKHESMRVGGRLESDIYLTPIDILDNFKMGGILHFEGIKGKWGFFSDAVYLQLGDSTRNSLRSGLPGSVMEALMRVRGAKIEGDVIQALADVGPMYRIHNETYQLDLLLGLRYVLLDLDFGLGPLSLERERDWLEPIIGARYRKKLTEKWGMSFRGDLGGFGIGSEFAAMAVLQFGYRLSPHTRLGIGMRYIYFDYDHDGLEYETHTYGPMMGLTFLF